MFQAADTSLCQIVNLSSWPQARHRKIRTSESPPSRGTTSTRCISALQRQLGSSVEPGTSTCSSFDMTAPAGKFYVHCGQWIDNLLSVEAQKFADCVFSALEPAQPNAVMPTRRHFMQHAEIPSLHIGFFILIWRPMTFLLHLSDIYQSGSQPTTKSSEF
jgi:hypothetical protein